MQMYGDPLPDKNQNSYFMSFLDNYSKKCWVYFMRNTSKSFKFKLFKNKVETHMGKRQITPK